MAIILGIDTATSGCSVALMDGDVCRAERAERMTRGQSEALVPMMQAVLAEARVSYGALDAIAVTRGPGAFTGLRIGIAAARAAALAAGCACIGVGTFAALAAQAVAAGNGGWRRLLVAVESKREEPYLQLFDAAGVAESEAFIEMPGAIAARIVTTGPLALAGDAAGRVLPHLEGAFDVVLLEGIDVPDAKTVARLATAHLAAPETAPADPVYLRPPDVTMPAGG